MFSAHRRRRTALLVIIGLMVMLGTTTQLAAAKRETPFHARLVVLNEPPVMCAPAQLCLALTGNGHATHLTAANGDQLSLLLSEVNCQTGATSGITAITHGTWVVTGGIGRFSGARGSGAYTTYINSPEAIAWVDLSGTLTKSDSSRMKPGR